MWSTACRTALIHVVACCNKEKVLTGWGGDDEVCTCSNGCFGFIVCVLTLSVLVNVIVEDSTEGLLECTRVYGNLSRHAPVRDVLARNKGDSLSLSLSIVCVCLKK